MSIFSIWVVMSGDYEDSWIVAAYTTAALAHDHVDRTGVGRVEQVEVLSALPEDVAAIDPIAARQAREVDAEKARAAYQAEQAHAQAQADRTDAMTIGDRATLCHCLTFNESTHFITAHGYCRYCGGWTPDVFRVRFGWDGLAEAIDRLAVHDREKMRQLTGLGSRATGA